VAQGVRDELDVAGHVEQPSREAVTRGVQHEILRQTEEVADPAKLLREAGEGDVLRLRSCRGEHVTCTTTGLNADGEAVTDSIAHRHIADRLLRLTSADEDDAEVPQYVLPTQSQDFAGTAAGVHHGDENVLERLSCFSGNPDFDFLIENVTPLPLLQEGDGRHFPKQTPLLGNCQHPAQRT
jgi:hypothetical protein